MNISCVIITKNEEENIKDCINSVSFADEVIVIDDYSTDKTIKIAKYLGAKVYFRKLDSDFSKQRNYGLKKAMGEWVIFLDADERVTKNLSREIVRAISRDSIIDGFFIKRRDIMWGKQLKHGEVGGNKLLRLAKKSEGQWMRKVHETWKVRGETSILRNPLLHYPHPTLRDFIENVRYMSKLHAQANMSEGKRSSLFKIIVWPAGHFFYNFIVRLGFLDGIRGFIVASIMSFHSYLSWSTLWLIQKRN